MELTVKDFITFGLTALSLLVGSFGLLLSLYNAWRTTDKDRVKLKVVPRHSFTVGPSRQYDKLSIEVTNYSAFPVTITEVGILYHNSDSRGCIVMPLIRDGGPFPRKLEPMSAFSAYAELHTIDPSFFIKARCAYATTACGVTAEGNSPAFQEIILHSLNAVGVK